MVRLLLWVEHCKSLDLRAGWCRASGGTGFDVESLPLFVCSGCICDLGSMKGVGHPASWGTGRCKHGTPIVKTFLCKRSCLTRPFFPGHGLVPGTITCFEMQQNTHLNRNLIGGSPKPTSSARYRSSTQTPSHTSWAQSRNPESPALCPTSAILWPGWTQLAVLIFFENCCLGCSSSSSCLSCYCFLLSFLLLLVCMNTPTTRTISACTLWAHHADKSQGGRISSDACLRRWMPPGCPFSVLFAER